MCYFSTTTRTREHHYLWLEWILIYIEFSFGLCQDINVNCWIHTHQHNAFHLHQAHTPRNTDRRRTQVCSHRSAHRHVSPQHRGPELQDITAWVWNSLTFYNAQVDYRSKINFRNLWTALQMSSFWYRSCQCSVKQWKPIGSVTRSWGTRSSTWRQWLLMDQWCLAELLNVWFPKEFKWHSSGIFFEKEK